MASTCRCPNVSDKTPTKAPSEAPKPTATEFESIALLLQGGGALGSYQAGVYQALIERNIEPTWVAGISIGSINAAIIAGNPSADRVVKLRTFWEDVTSGTKLWGNWANMFTGGDARGFLNQFSAGQSLTNGVPGFFAPRFPPPLLQRSGTPAATSWYDTSELRATLERLVDFDRINAKQMRFSVGAVNVRTGNFAYFDNASDNIRPEHIMASAALPPAFPAVEIDGEFYWDGGMVSNTPLDWVLSAPSDLDTLVFQIDLWSARGALPRDLSEVVVRMKEIQYSSRTRAATDQFERGQKLRLAFNQLFAKLPAEFAKTPQAQMLAKAADPAHFNIVHLIYRSPTYEGQSKDYEFSRKTMQDHWAAGYRDAKTTLAHPEILSKPKTAVEVYDFVTPSDERHMPARSPKKGE